VYNGRRNNMMREIYTSSGDLEDPEVTKQREEKVLQELSVREIGLQSEELRRVLQLVNFDELKTLFLEEAESLGVNTEGLNFLGRERVASYDSDAHPEGQYSVFYNLIYLALGEKGEMSDVSKIQFLIHEQTHAISKNVCHGINKKRKWERPNLRETGYYKNRLDGPPLKFEGKEKEAVFVFFNEGVVEKLSREITFKYLTGKMDPEKIEGLQKFVEKQGYQLGVDIVDLMINKISEKTGNDKELIWAVFKKGLLNGLSFEEENISAFFEKEFGVNFLDELADLLPYVWAANIREDAEKFIEKYK
jgi:hypothetical protein